MTTLRQAAEQALEWIAAKPDDRVISADRMVRILSLALEADTKPCVCCGDGNSRLSVTRICDACGSEYAGQAEMDMAKRIEVEQQAEQATWYHKHWGKGDDIFYLPTDAIPDEATPLYTRPQPLAHSVIAGAMFDFMGWLTSRSEKICLSSTELATPAVDAIVEFAELRGLRLNEAQVKHWPLALKPQPAQQLTDEQIINWVETGEYNVITNDWASHIEFARAIERAHGITGGTK